MNTEEIWLSARYGIINWLLTLYVMRIVLGLSMGMQRLSVMNFGAQKLNRVKQTLRLGILSGVVITSSGFLICELFPHAVSALFTDSDELIDLAVEGLRLAVLMFPFAGAQIVIGNFFQSIGKSENKHFLVPDATVALSSALPVAFPELVGIERYLDQYAGVGCISLYHSSNQLDDIY